MKMTKKVLLATVVAAAVMFTGCMKELGNDLFKYTDATYESANGKATIDYDNDSDSIKRGVKFLRSKHEGLTAIITIENQTDTDTDGMLGICFAGVENKDAALANNGTWNFGIVGTQNNGSSGNGYVSNFYNISEDNFDAKNFGAWTGNENSGSAITKEDYASTTYTSYEVESSLKYSTSGHNLSGAKPDLDGNFVIVVKIVPKTDGGYTVTFYKGSVVKNRDTVTTDASELEAAQIEKVVVATADTQFTSETQTKFGFYANVYAGKKLKGSVKLLDVQGNPIPIEWDEDFEACPLFE